MSSLVAFGNMVLLVASLALANWGTVLIKRGFEERYREKVNHGMLILPTGSLLLGVSVTQLISSW